jgi:sugar lactone lactonase YvrE
MKKRALLAPFIVLMLLVAAPPASSGVLPKKPARDDDAPRLQFEDDITVHEEFYRGKPYFYQTFYVEQSTPGTGAPDLTGEPGLVFRLSDMVGVTGEPYRVDPDYLYRPAGIYIDGADNLFVAEFSGNRVRKYDPSGTNTLTISEAGPYSFFSPQDVALADDGTIWVGMDYSPVYQYDSSGGFLRALPWTPYESPASLGFDSSGRLFISDPDSHVVWIFELQDDTPVLVGSIGEQYSPGEDQAHLRDPFGIALDSLDRLYIVDRGNFRVQRCVEDPDWTCTTFHGTGSSGTGTAELGEASGIWIAADDHAYIADSSNGRVKKCAPEGTCEVLITGLLAPRDVATDSSGAVYVSDYDDFTVRKYASDGTFLEIFAGTSGEAYPIDYEHFFGPEGVDVDAEGNIFVANSGGFNAVKLDAMYNGLWRVGTPGVQGADNEHFGSGSRSPMGVDISVDGRLYLADPSNARVQVYGSDGDYLDTLVFTADERYEFQWPIGVATDGRGYVYVADYDFHQIWIFDSELEFSGSIGYPGVSGTGVDYLNRPADVAVDHEGNIYVADYANERVQKFGGNHNWVHTLGETNADGIDFDRFDTPRSVDVDAAGRVYVLDSANARVQVFGPDGDFLSIIGGEAGTGPGQLYTGYSGGVAVDGVGNVYITDYLNQRMLKYSPGLDEWTQANINGFGVRGNLGVNALGSFNGELYAGTVNFFTGGDLWRLGASWDRVASLGSFNHGISALAEYDGTFYAATWNQSGAELWRSPTGDSDSWVQVVSGGFGDSANTEITSLIGYDGYLYAGTWTEDGDGHGGEVWRSATGDEGSWAPAALDGFGSGDAGVHTFEIFGGALYAATGGPTNGAGIWRSDNGVNWAQVNEEGFGAPESTDVASLAVFGDRLYAGTWNENGARVWASADGEAWTQVNSAGFGQAHNLGISALVPFDGALHAVVANFEGGAQVWQLVDEAAGNWSPVIEGGFGQGRAARTYFEGGALVHGNTLYVGTHTWGNGGGRLFALQGSGPPPTETPTPSPTSTPTATFTPTPTPTVTATSTATATTTPSLTPTSPPQPPTPTPTLPPITPKDGIGVYYPAEASFRLRYTLEGGPADVHFSFGVSSPKLIGLGGDWDGDGRTGMGVYDACKGLFQLRETPSGGPPDYSFQFGYSACGAWAFSGDWDADGRDGVGVYLPETGEFLLSNSLSGAAPDLTLRYGRPSPDWLPIAGDWDGDGRDGVGLYNPARGVFLILNSLTSAGPDLRFRFGPRGDQSLPVVGDWDGEGLDTVGVFRIDRRSFYLRNSLSRGPADYRFRFGMRGQWGIPLSGDWDG